MSKEGRIRLNIPVIVEGKYDKNVLQSVIDANIITTDGFGIFNNKEKELLIKKLSFNGIIVLCDSDGAGTLIRSRLSSFLPEGKTYPLYVPQITGKEKRKKEPSKEGFLGVEGIDRKTLEAIFVKFADNHPEFVDGKDVSEREEILASDLYEKGLSGKKESQAARDSFCRKIGLPSGMNAKSLRLALNMIITKKDFSDII